MKLKPTLMPSLMPTETKLDGIATGAEVNDPTTLLDADISTTVQAWDNDLDDIAALTHTDRALLQSDGTDWTKVTEADIAVPNRQTVKSFQAGSAASYLSIPDDPSVDVGTGDFSVFWWAKMQQQYSNN